MLESDRIIRGGRNPVQVIEPLPLLLRSVRHVLGCPELPKSGIILAPSQLYQHVLSLASFDVFGYSAFGPTSGVGAIENEMRHFLRMTNRVSDSDRATLGNPQDGKTIQTQGVHDRLEVLDECFEGKVFDVPIREPVSSLVVSNQKMISGKF